VSSVICERYCILSYSVTHSHTTVLWPFFWDYPGELVPEEILLWTLWCKGKQGRHTDNPAGHQCATAPGHHSIWTNQQPTSIIPPSLLWMPFLSQPSQFILAWDRHQICWLAYPVVLFMVLYSDKYVNARASAARCHADVLSFPSTM